MAGTIALVTFLILSSTRVLSVFDARMARAPRAGGLLQKANAELMRASTPTAPAWRKGSGT